MLTTTAREIVGVVGGELIGSATGDERVTGVARVDSRAIAPGDLFAAFVGERTDGHRFVASAHGAGAALSLVSQHVQHPAVLVDDVEEALATLAHHQLEQARHGDSGLRVVAITGSAGKTGTKDLLGALLAEIAPTIAPQGSHNNELGLPLTVLALRPETRFLVLEMGARGVGHIAHLTRIARPDVSLVLNVGTAHLGEFGSVEAIARAKGEIIEALPEAGRAILNADDSRVAAMAERTDAAVATWGVAAGQVRARDIHLDELGRTRFTLEVAGGLHDLDGHPIPPSSHPIALPLLGEHQALNAVAASTAALTLGMDTRDLVRVLPGIEHVSAQRMQAIRAPGGITVINDAYNANPDSMRQALKTLAHIGQYRRTVAVLGTMLELGEDSVRLHDEVGRLAVRLNISRLIVVGEQAAGIHRGACLEGSFGGESELVPDRDAALARLVEYLRADDVVLLKSSRDTGLRELADPLVEALGAREAPTPVPPTMTDSERPGTGGQDRGGAPRE